MATRYYNGSTNTDWSNTANWDSTTRPSSGDSVVIRSDCVNNIAGYDDTAVLLVSFRIQAGCAVDIGSSGSKLKISADIAEFNQTAGDQWIALQDGNGAGGVTALDVKGGLATSAPTTEGLHLSSNTTDTFSPCRVHSGQVQFDEDCNFATLDVMGGTVYLYDADGLTTINQVGGAIYNSCGDAITTLNLSGSGVFYHLEGAAAITTVNVWGGTADFRAAATITTLNGRSGLITFASQKLQSTVTTCNLWAASLDLRSGIGSPTFTNPINRYGTGQVYADTGTTTTATVTP